MTVFSYLFNPLRFLTAITQVHSRRFKLELDSLEIETTFPDSSHEAAKNARLRDGVYVTGLMLVGARWNVASSFLEESLPLQLYDPLPALEMRAVNRRIKPAGVFRAPVYRTSTRSAQGGFLFTVDLPCGQVPSNKWVLAGTAVLLDTE